MERSQRASGSKRTTTAGGGRRRLPFCVYTKMVNKLKKFFRQMGGKPSASSAAASGGFAVLPSSENQYLSPRQYQRQGFASDALRIDTAGSSAVVAAPSPGTRSGSSDHSGTSSSVPEVKWGSVLSKIPKLVADATTASPNTQSSEEMATLTELLSQMAAKEQQTQILHFYMGHAFQSPRGRNLSISNWEQRRVFRQCRRALLLCWKFVLGQLNDDHTHISDERKDMYFQLIGLVAQRVEFNLMDTGAAASSTSSSGRSAKPSSSRNPAPQATANNFGWQANSPTSASVSALELSSTSETIGSSSNEPEGSEGERDMYLYRCLLVATFKYVVENIDAARVKKRSFITISESKFFANIMAVCFFRVPVIQSMILDHVFQAYKQKKWATQAPTDEQRTVPPLTSSFDDPVSRMNRRRSSTKPWSGISFNGSLYRWSEFDGQILDESDNSADYDPSSSSFSDQSSDSGDSNHTPSSYAAPSRAVIDKFKKLNPTLLRWGKYAPYLGPYADSDVFRMHETMRSSWLEKLTHDGEFFAMFMGSYALHADVVAVGEILWSSLPGYVLLIRSSLLLLREVCMKKFLYVSEAAASPTMEFGDPDDRQPFSVSMLRGVKTVLESVSLWLRNKDIIESCVLAVYECTNLFVVRSVENCLSRLEEWFRIAATQSDPSNGAIVYQLPASFTGHSFAIGIRLLLSSDSFEILNRVLQFLYNRIDYFAGELRQNILKAIVQRHMHLFLHWNVDVRNSYHHLLVYKIVRINRYLLDSPIDHLLIGRYAISPSEAENPALNEYEDHDDADSPVHHSNADHGQPFDMTTAEFNALRLEQALWRAFDACIACICGQERKNAREGNIRYQNDLLAARSRAIAFQRLNRQTADDAEMTDKSEGLPGGKPWHEVELLDEELRREPPYYLRYLPAEEVAHLEDLQRMASTVKYPLELQVYASLSLRNYSDLLKNYYRALSTIGSVEAPPLGFY